MALNAPSHANPALREPPVLRQLPQAALGLDPSAGRTAEGRDLAHSCANGRQPQEPSAPPCPGHWSERLRWSGKEMWPLPKASWDIMG